MTMLAVPGWSISTDALKFQTEPAVSKLATEHEPDHPNGTDRKKSRKRKRGLGSSNALEITEENIGDLWRKYIEEKDLDQSKPKKEENQTQQINEGKDDTLANIDDVDRGSFEGFSEEDKVVGAAEGEALLKKRKKNKKKRKDDNTAGTIQANGHKDAAEASSPSVKEQVEIQDGKSKYEQRKAKASKKREQRALLQANGTLPPIRPEAISNHPTETVPTNPTQNAETSESSKAPDTLSESTVTRSTTFQKAPGPSKPSRAPDTSQTPAPSLQQPTKLTPLQQRMAAKLTSARFRHLNQTLYTSPSDEAMRLFTNSPQNYTSYHAGFRAQVALWPQNPVDGFIEDIKARSRVSAPPRQKKLWREQKKEKKGTQLKRGSDGDTAAGTTTVQAGGGEKADPLPRSRNGTCTIVDLGCGDANLAASLSPSATSLGLKLLSFDLAKGDTPNAHLITVADISNLSAAGVKDGTVDIAICCLSLMGTNWVDVVGECARIVRGGGEVWVAEIKSRFARPGVPTKKEKAGGGGGIGRKKKKSTTWKGRDGVGDEDDEAMALEDIIEDAEVKGPIKAETDVGAFVEVFRKRGLLVKGEPDMANKMFVKMRFAKTVSGARLEKGGGGGERVAEGRKMHAKTKFVERDVVEEVDESKVLKPCVYKTR